MTSRLGGIRSTWRRQTWAAAAAGAVLVFVLVGLALTKGGFLGGGEPIVGEQHPPLLIVRFSPKAAVTDLTRFLQANKAVMVGGPLKGGHYEVRLTDREATPDAIERLAKQLRAQAGFVEFVAVKH